MAGAAATGAAIGGVAGPVGAALGAAAGAVVGALAGKGVAKADPTIAPSIEEAYWREHHQRRPYAGGSSYEVYNPAYQYGVHAYNRNAGRSFDDVDEELGRGWASGSSIDNVLEERGGDAPGLAVAAPVSMTSVRIKKNVELMSAPMSPAAHSADGAMMLCGVMVKERSRRPVTWEMACLPLGRCVGRQPRRCALWSVVGDSHSLEDQPQ